MDNKNVTLDFNQGLEFVNKKIAKLATERGYNLPTGYFFANEDYDIIDVYKCGDIGIVNSDDIDSTTYSNVYLAPSYYDLISWLYKKGFFPVIVPGSKERTFKGLIYRVPSNEIIYTSEEHNNVFLSMEDALIKVFDEIETLTHEIVDYETAILLSKINNKLKSNFSYIEKDDVIKLVDNNIIKNNQTKVPAVSKVDLEKFLETEYDVVIRFDLTKDYRFQFKIGSKDKRKKETEFNIFDSHSIGISETYRHVLIDIITNASKNNSKQNSLENKPNHQQNQKNISNEIDNPKKDNTQNKFNKNKNHKKKQSNAIQVANSK